MLKKKYPEFKKYVFKTNINSIYQMFWVTYEMLKISPSVELNFDHKKVNTIVSISNANVSASEIQFIFLENFIDYQEVEQE